MSGHGDGGDPGGVRDDAFGKDAPGTTTNVTPAGMELTFQADPAAFEEAAALRHTAVPETVDANQEKKTSSHAISSSRGNPANDNKGHHESVQFREQFDHLMKKLEDRFQNERLNLEEKHSRELEEAMGYFSLSSGEREAKQQELQISLLEDIGNMAQQLHELTGVLGAGEDVESLTIPSDPKLLEEYAQRMQHLEEQFQKEKLDLEQKHASEMEEALGTLKMTREQREAKQLELQDQLSAEIGDMAKQLEDLNRAKQNYEAKMGILKQQLTQDSESTRRKTTLDPNLRSITQRVDNVERERDAAKDELRRLKLAFQVSQGEPQSGKHAQAYTTKGSLFRAHPQTQQGTPLMQEMRPSQAGRVSISGLRGRIEQVERDVQEAAKTPGGSDTMKGLRERMQLIEKDLVAAEESTKEHFALEHLRSRLEKVEQLLTEGEKAAKDWEALEELRNKIGTVDNDLKAVEEAKKEYEALESLRLKMEAVEFELKAAEQMASDRENVDNLRARLSQVERELGLAEPKNDDRASVDKLLNRLAKAEKSLEDARESTMFSQLPDTLPDSDSQGFNRAERDEEVEKILERLALAEKKLKAAKDSAQRRNKSGYDSSNRRPKPRSHRPPSVTPFDERQSKIRARLQEHLDESSSSPRRRKPEEEGTSQAQDQQGQRITFEEPRNVGGRSRYYVQGVHLDRNIDRTLPYMREHKASAPGTRQAEIISDEHQHTSTRPLRRRNISGENQETRPQATTSMSFSVLGDDEDKYKADLEELRYQRSLLSQRLREARSSDEDDEEKKADDEKESGPKYSFREAIRNEEKERLRQMMQPLEKSPSREVLATSPNLAQGTVDDHFGGDPPTMVDKSHDDPPPFGLSVEELQERVNSTKNQPPKSPLDPYQSNGRVSVDPPDKVQSGTSFTKPKFRGAPSDEGSSLLESKVRAMENFVEADNASEVTDEPAIISPETIVFSQPSQHPRVRQPSSVRKSSVDQKEPSNEPLLQLSPPSTATPSAERHDQSAEAPRPPSTPPPPPASSGSTPIIHQTTVVDGRAAQRERRDKDRMMRWVILVLVCVMVILAAAIIVVVVLLRNDDDDSERSGPPTPSFPTTPTSLPELFPTASPAPTNTMIPSGENGTMPPLEGCPNLADPVPLASNGVTTERSTFGAMYDASALPACGAVSAVGSGGVWYAYIGTGESVTIHTCSIFFTNFDTQLFVYSLVDQSTGCFAGLECVGGNDNYCGLQSSVTFFAAADTLYFVYANGMQGGSSEGDFSLTIFQSPEGSCSGALGPLDIQPNNGMLPLIMVGTLMGGTFGVDPCNPELTSRTGELWYKVVGEGGMVVASTCHAVSLFPARLAIYTGNSCNDLICVTSDDEDCGLGSEVSWFAEEGVEYYVLVYSDVFVPDATFGISIQEVS